MGAVAHFADHVGRPEPIRRLDEDAARARLESMRWPEGPVCPRCGGSEVGKLQGRSCRPGLHRCRACRAQLSVTTRTGLAGTKIPLATWLLFFDLLRAGRRLTGRRLSRLLRVSYKTAWSMQARIQTVGLPNILSTVDGRWRYHAPRRIKTDGVGFLKLMALPPSADHPGLSCCCLECLDRYPQVPAMEQLRHLVKDARRLAREHAILQRLSKGYLGAASRAPRLMRS